MRVTDFDTERVRRRAVHRPRGVPERLEVVCGYFEPGQFIPVHALSSDIAIHVREGLRRGVFDPRAEVGD